MWLPEGRVQCPVTAPPFSVPCLPSPAARRSWAQGPQPGPAGNAEADKTPPTSQPLLSLGAGPPASDSDTGRSGAVSLRTRRGWEETP